MSASVQQLVGEFIDAWTAGARPDVDAYLARAGGSPERDELAGQLAMWLAIAPAPAYDEATLAQISAEPALVAALEAARLQGLAFAPRLALLRERAGLALRDVAARVVAVFALRDDDGAARAEAYLGRIERDELDATRLSRRLLDALAAILGADAALLAAPGPPAGRPALGQTLMRADEDAELWIAGDIDALSRAALTPAPAPLDELDRLFLGGPEG